MSVQYPPLNLITKKRHASTNSGSVIGYCHNISHPGELTAKILKEHDCVKKQCPLLEKYEDAQYWAQIRKKRAERKRGKAEAKKQKLNDDLEKDHLDNMRKEIQGYADQLEVDIDVISVKRIKNEFYRILYVNDNSYGDSQLYIDFHKYIKEMLPGHSFYFTHIKDATGNFVTRDEYRMWKKSYK